VGLLLVAVVLVTNPFGEAASSQNQPDEDT
jgi:hypothetical protein